MPVIETRQLRLRFNAAKCHGFGQCRLTLSQVIRALSGREDATGDPEAEDRLRQAVAVCPSGALTCRERYSGAKTGVRGTDRVRERRFYLP